jgi:hypothetical protein
MYLKTPSPVCLDSKGLWNILFLFYFHNIKTAVPRYDN